MTRFLAALLAGLTSLSAADSYDVCVYGGNASGVMAACAAAKEGAKVIVVEPTGSETQVVAKVGSQELVCVFRERITAKPGRFSLALPKP